jgi:hypothetical protein
VYNNKAIEKGDFNMKRIGILFGLAAIGLLASCGSEANTTTEKKDETTTVVPTTSETTTVVPTVETPTTVTAPKVNKAAKQVMETIAQQAPSADVFEYTCDFDEPDAVDMSQVELDPSIFGNLMNK